MHSGFAIALAWPETLCKQAGSWYDTPLGWVGLRRGFYYKVGHAAVILINTKTGSCHYFDFGRYHSPFQFGRVRNETSDHDLIINAKAIIKDKKITNYYEILLEVFNNGSCHGSGDLFASYCTVDFDRAFNYAVGKQNSSPIPYGPFIPNGTNCSRFVSSVILAGRPNLLVRLLLFSPRTLSPTPIGNVRALTNQTTISLKDIGLRNIRYTGKITEKIIYEIKHIS